MKIHKHHIDDKTKIKYLFVIAMCMLAIALGIHQAVAAYISVSNMKAVASTNENESLFNSNLLYGYRSNPSSIETNSIVLDSDGEVVKMTITIFNYHKQDINLVNPLDVKYDFSVAASGAPDGNYSGYSVNDTGLDSNHKYSQTGVLLYGRNACKQSYTVQFPKSHLDYAQFTVIAKVDDKSGGVRGTNLDCLAAIIVPSQYSEVASPIVRGTLVETGDPADYDAYNYEITIGGMASDVEINWNSNYVELDPFFAEEAKVNPRDGTATVRLEPGTRIIQFYQVKQAYSWNDLGLGVRRK